MAKYLDLTGLSHYDQKIKQYISQHSGGALYKHVITLANQEMEMVFSFLSSRSTQYSKSDVFSNTFNNIYEEVIYYDEGAGLTRLGIIKGYNANSASLDLTLQIGSQVQEYGFESSEIAEFSDSVTQL